ncbi:hypothetical protein TKK_0008868 [Trichogramma kaykai]
MNYFWSRCTWPCSKSRPSDCRWVWGKRLRCALWPPPRVARADHKSQTWPDYGANGAEAAAAAIRNPLGETLGRGSGLAVICDAYVCSHAKLDYLLAKESYPRSILYCSSFAATFFPDASDAT